MSVLDKAFLKAYRKDKPSPRVSPRPRSEAAPAVPHATPDEAVSQETGPDRFDLNASVYRVDTCQPGQATENLHPHIELAPNVGFADLAFVSPYYNPLSAPSDEPVDDTASDTDAAPEQAHSQMETAETSEIENQARPPVDDPATTIDSQTAGQAAEEMSQPNAGPNVRRPAADPPEQPAATPTQNEMVQTLKEAASITLPPTLELPNVFRAPDDESDQALPVAEAEAFSPEWEVDHFAWPVICERLLETQSRYFEHVGQRLLDATSENHHVIMISGSRRGEGRTTLAMCLARCATQAGVQVALVDADMQNPELGARLGMESPCSWLDAFAGTATLGEVAVASIEDQLTLIPLSDSEQVDILAGDRRLIGLLRKISAHFPLVIVDAGPVLSRGSHLFDGDEVCPVDTAIVVRDLRNTTETEAMATAEGLQRSGIQAVGVAENFRAA